MDRVAAAGRFIEQHGRDIDRANFAYPFDRADTDGVIEALEQYRNEGDGFGHGLEPDILTPVSNPFATEIALGMCRDAHVPGEHSLLPKTVAYLGETQDEGGNWRAPSTVAGMLILKRFGRLRAEGDGRMEAGQ